MMKVSLTWVAKDGSVDDVKRSIPEDQINEPDENGWTALKYAIFGDNIPVVEYLIQKGARFDQQYIFSVESVEMLVLLRSLVPELDLETRSVNRGWKLLHKCCHLLYFPLIRYLIIDCKDRIDRDDMGWISCEYFGTRDRRKNKAMKRFVSERIIERKSEKLLRLYKVVSCVRLDSLHRLGLFEN